MTMTRTQHVIVAAISVFALVISEVSAGQNPVNIGSASTYVILAKTTITSTGTTSIKGNIGVSPAAASTITGFALKASSDGTHATSTLVEGKVHAADYAKPTPETLTKAVADMEAAYTEASTRKSPDFTNHAAGTIKGVTLKQGLYKWTTALNVGGTITISGGDSDVFIFQTDGALNFAADTKIELKDGAKAANVFWVSAGAVTLGAGSSVKGIILGKTTIVFAAGAKHTEGRALAQTAVTMIGNTVSQP